MQRRTIRLGLWGLLVLAGLWLAGGGIGLVTGSGTAEAQDRDRGGYLGVYLQELNEELRDAYGYHGPGGVLIRDVEDGGPAARAGIRRGDLLLEYRGRRIHDAGELRERLRGDTAGDEVRIGLWRDDRERTFTVTLGEERGRRLEQRGRAERRERAERRGRQAPRVEIHRDGDEPYVLDLEELEGMGHEMRRMFGGRPRLGVRTQDLNEGLGRYFEVPGGRGVLVTEVIDDTPAERAGLEAGDVILEVDGERVDDTQDLVHALQRQDEGEVAIEIQRRGARRTLSAVLEARGEAHGYSWNRRDDGDRRRRIVVPRAPRPPRAPRLELRRERAELEREMRELRREMEELRDEMRELRRRR